MLRTGAIVVIAALVAAACTPSDASPPDTADTSTTTIASITTLPPATTTTTVAPTTTTTSTTIPLPENDCEVTPVTDSEDYGQGCTVLGIEILAAEEIDPAAVTDLADRAYNLLVQRPEYAQAIATYPIGIRVIGTGQQIDELPEFEEIYFHHPGFDWRRAGRTFPGTEIIPFAAGAEENLLCSDDDRYVGEDMFLKDFAITIRRFAMDAVDTSTSQAIEQAYGVAIAEGKWVNTLAEIDSDQYWSEGVQSYFDANLEDLTEEREPNSSHNHVNTRDELREYDPFLWSIASSVFGETEWRPSCA